MNLFYSLPLLKLEYDNFSNEEININWFNDFIKKTYELEEKNKNLINQIKNDISQEINRLELNEQQKNDISISEEFNIKFEKFILDFASENTKGTDNFFNLQKSEKPYFLISFLQEENRILR